ncbi:Transposable element Tcb2 transposase [Exaiptasia diaphana]|nr:Transposable element Tcb2 transposase [Exaiptasia diaphana]
MVRTSDYVKLRVLNSFKKRRNVAETVRKLRSDDGIKIDRRTVSKLFKKFKTGQSTADKPNKGRTPTITKQHYDFIDQKLEENDELTSVGLQRLFREEMGICPSLSTIKRTRAKLGWQKTGPRYCQVVRETNRIARLSFAERCAAENEQFNNVLFTDESSIHLERHGKICFTKKGMLPKLKPKAKHPYKVHVWAGICKKGATKIVIFTGIMKSDFYIENILKAALIPYVKEAFPDGIYRFQQDNDPKHKSRLTMKFIEDNGIQYWPTPAESPDLNPIEMLWHELKNHLRCRVKPKNKEELVEGIKEFWKIVTPEKTTKYISHLQKVIPDIIARQGKASGH